MKKVFFILIAAMLFATSGLRSQEIKAAPSGQDQQTIAMYYFHTNFRCVTCRTVEAESEKAFESLFPEAFKNGNAIFQAVNIEDEVNAGLVERYKIGGQTLLLVKGEKTTDLTSQGFLYAKSNPDKLKEEIKDAFDKL